jgi:hypothetical protein
MRSAGGWVLLEAVPPAEEGGEEVAEAAAE